MPWRSDGTMFNLSRFITGQEFRLKQAESLLIKIEELLLRTSRNLLQR